MQTLASNVDGRLREVARRTTAVDTLKVAFLTALNIDDLHERAGTRKLLHIHGEILKSRRTSSGRVQPQTGDIGPDDRRTCCGSTGTLRPHVVRFGEMPLEMDRIFEALRRRRVLRLFTPLGDEFSW